MSQGHRPGLRPGWLRGLVRGPAVALGLSLAVPACSSDPVHEPLSAKGALLARDPTVSRSRYNAFACLTCHAEHPADVGTRVLPGGVLEGVARRPTYWGGETTSLREAVLRCWTDFMRGVPEDLDGPTGAALDAWLTALSPAEPGQDGGAPAVAVTWPRSITDLAPGNGTHGGVVYHRACSVCHGEPGAGPVLGLSSVIPDDTIRAHDVPGMCTPGMCGSYVRQIIIEKVRHGSFLGYAGNMAPFATEILSDTDLADVLAYLNLPNN